MRFIKTVSVLSIMVVGMSSVVHAAPMTSQIRRLLEEKEEKIKQLEQCDSKRKGWMIAGISTIGLTAVGVGVNIAQASKSNKLSDDIDSAKQELERYEYKLSNINSQISDKERERAEKEKTAREKADDTQAGIIEEYNGKTFGFETIREFIDGLRSTYLDISIECGDKYAYAFIPEDETGAEFQRITNECISAGGTAFEKIGDKQITKPDGNQMVVVYQCKAEWNCDANASVTKYDVSIDGEDDCYYAIDGDDKKDKDGCKVSKPGDWGVKFSYGTVKGISACSDLPGSHANKASDQGRVESAYTSKATSNPSGNNCYCKVTNSDIAGARWVFDSSLSNSDASDCAEFCAFDCAFYVQSDARFRGAVFGVDAQ